MQSAIKRATGTSSSVYAARRFGVAVVVHAAVLPCYVLIEPKDHKLALTGWSFATRSNPVPETLKAISLSYESWYPPEVFQKAPPTPALDLCLAARSALFLMGLDPLGDASAPSSAMPPAYASAVRPRRE